VKHLPGEFAKDGGEVGLVRGSTDMDGLEVGVALQLNTAKNVAGADEESDINQLLDFSIHRGGGTGMKAAKKESTKGCKSPNKVPRRLPNNPRELMRSRKVVGTASLTLVPRSSQSRKDMLVPPSSMARWISAALRFEAR